MTQFEKDLLREVYHIHQGVEKLTKVPAMLETKLFADSGRNWSDCQEVDEAFAGWMSENLDKVVVWKVETGCLMNEQVVGTWIRVFFRKIAKGE